MSCSLSAGTCVTSSSSTVSQIGSVRSTTSTHLGVAALLPSPMAAAVGNVSPAAEVHVGRSRDASDSSCCCCCSCACGAGGVCSPCGVLGKAGVGPATAHPLSTATAADAALGCSRSLSALDSCSMQTGTQWQQASSLSVSAGNCSHKAKSLLHAPPTHTQSPHPMCNCQPVNQFPAWPNHLVCSPCPVL